MFIIKYKWVFLIFSVIIIAASIVAVIIFGLNRGIDFVGGTLWQVKGLTRAEIASVIPEAVIIPESDGAFLVRSKEIAEAEHQQLVQIFNKISPLFEEQRFESIGPAIGKELEKKALTAFVLVILAISLYIAFAFRKVSRPVSSWKYGIITIVTLFHDAIIPAGMMAVLGYLLGVEIDINFIVAILVVMGFSVHDTIVVFDRIRENVRLSRDPSADFSGLVGRSISETVARSINTSLTLIIVLFALYFLGSATLSYFTLVVLVGTIIGAYSSICIASPLLVLWRGKGAR